MATGNTSRARRVSLTRQNKRAALSDGLDRRTDPERLQLLRELIRDISVHDELKRALAIRDRALIERLIHSLEQRRKIVRAGSVAEEVLREREGDLLLLGFGPRCETAGSGLHDSGGAA